MKHLVLALMMFSGIAYAQDAELEEGNDVPVTIVAHADNYDGTSVYLLDINEDPCPTGSSVALKAEEKAIIDKGCWVYDEQNSNVVIFWFSTRTAESVAATDFYKGGSH